MVELLIVASVVFVLVSGITLTLSQAGQQVWVRMDGALVSLSDAQRALDRVSEDLRQASQANLVCAAGQLDFDLIGGGHITYILDANTKRLTRDDATLAKVVADGIASFTPTCQAGSGLVRLHLLAQRTTPAGSWNQPLDSQVFVQNP